jgi:hypothetical protein
MSAPRAFIPRQTKKVSPVSPESGLALVSHELHGKYGPRLPCKSCASSERVWKGNYLKNLAGKRDGEDRYYRRWSCTTGGKFACPSLGNAAYIEWAKTQLARDSFCSAVETVRGGFPVESVEHHRLGLLLQDGPSPSIGSPSLKRKATQQVTPPSPKRRLQFFGSGHAASPSIDQPSVRKLSGDFGSPVLPTTVTTKPLAVTTSNSSFVCSQPSDLIGCLVDIRARLDRIIDSYSQVNSDRTRQNSLSPEEYIGIHESRGLALRATAGPPTPPDRLSPSNPLASYVETCIEVSPLDAHTPSSDVEKDPRDSSVAGLAATLAADFHSANASEKKDLRTRARRGNVVAAFEEEVRRVGALARRHA